MAYVVCQPCIGAKDRSCVEVCPVDCFYDIKDKKYNDEVGVEAPVISSGEGGEDRDYGMLMIHPDECINCGACETECPTEAIYEDSSVPEEWSRFIEENAKVTSAMSDEELDAARCTAKL